MRSCWGSSAHPHTRSCGPLPAIRRPIRLLRAASVRYRAEHADPRLARPRGALRRPLRVVRVRRRFSAALPYGARRRHRHDPRRVAHRREARPRRRDLRRGLVPRRLDSHTPMVSGSVVGVTPCYRSFGSCDGYVENFLMFDRYFYAENSATGWLLAFTDGQDRLNQFDMDDRGLVYVAYRQFGWGMASDLPNTLAAWQATRRSCRRGRTRVCVQELGTRDAGLLGQGRGGLLRSRPELEPGGHARLQGAEQSSVSEITTIAAAGPVCSRAETTTRPRSYVTVDGSRHL